ncbi:NitT/TauT family transport system ATP-binding protein [Asanoa ferruginea]|uniref:NitT/TauT family transport system ATP-binding protein n=1 Tax=Asanoa ferruginea TaxID=53367 RepID=A0A3D9ZP87_9ACTN|nr:ABC transporter ATP-binding protein [Asanoa ferruginea]REF99186.1 NitT/TauT family transport system ATP-binding protein [Asanoa ferruginea]GIF45777.1 ABC transporter ATP-binding protein [Asanoa ferruginea]
MARTTSGYAIEGTGLGKSFAVGRREVKAFAGIDLRVGHGEFVAILGASGGGKTTLLRVLARLEEHTEGQLVVRAADTGSGRPPSATVFQEPSAFPWMSVRRNIAYGMWAVGVGRAEQRREVDRLLEMVGLSAFADAYPHELSGGMKQRVAVARALAVGSEILFMDEPFGLLDEQTRLALQQDLIRIWEQTRKTIVFVTHSIQEAIVLADRVLVLSSRPGRIVLSREVPFGRPRNAFDLGRDPAFAELAAELHDALVGDGHDSAKQGSDA